MILDLDDAGRRLSLAQIAPTPPLAKLQAMRARRARRRRIGLAGSAVGVIAAASGFSVWLTSGSPRTDHIIVAPGGVPSESPKAVVEAAVSRTKVAGSAAFEYSNTSASEASTWIGTVDFTHNEFMMTTYNGKPGPSTKSGDIRVIGSTTYQRAFQPNLPGGGTSPWVKTNQKIGTFDWVFFPLSDPHLVASYVGPSVVQGTPSYLYNVDIPAGTMAGTSAAPYRIEVWLDGSGRIRQASTTRSIFGRAGSSIPETATQTLTLSQFGIPVTVTAPSLVAP